MIETVVLTGMLLPALLSVIILAGSAWSVKLRQSGSRLDADQLVGRIAFPRRAPASAAAMPTRAALATTGDRAGHQVRRPDQRGSKVQTGTEGRGSGAQRKASPLA
jgi:hypothetical protein